MGSSEFPRVQMRRKAAPKKDRAYSLNDTVKKFYKDKKGKLYHITPFEAFQMKIGIDPNANSTSSLSSIKMKPVVVDEVTKPTKAMKVLFGEGKKIK